MSGYQRLVVPALLIVSAVATATVGAQIVTTLDSNGAVGAGSAVAYGPNGLALVSYLDSTNGNLKVAACQNVACTAATLHTIDPSGTVGGASTSIAFGADGRALIAYQDQATASVKVAHCADAECTTATRFTVDDLAALVPGTAIGVGADGLGIVTYIDATGNVLKVGHCNDADCTSCTVTAHPISVTVPFPSSARANPSLTIGGDGLALFSVDDGNNIYVGHCSNSACTSATFSAIAAILSPPTHTWRYRNASLATGESGFGVIAASAEESFNSPGGSSGPFFYTVLRRCQNAACTGFVGNGSASNFFSPAVAVAPGDLPLVAHYGDGGVPPSRLQVTTCLSPTCAVPPAQTRAIDAPGIGQEPAIAVGPEGIGLVSYYGPGTLKVAYLVPPPVLSIDDVAIAEGNSGLTSAVFTVKLSYAANATVQYATAGGTATSGLDFLAASGTLTFTPGSLTQTVTVSVVSDLTVEDNEIFQVGLSNAQGADILDGVGVSTILDDDVQAALPIAGELEHGSNYFGNLAANPGPTAHVDYFRIRQDPYSSYEIVVDGISGDATPLDLSLKNSSGTVSTQTGSVTGTGSSVHVAWRYTSGSASALNELVRVSGSCGATCGSADVYRLRMFETTLSGARFNNAGSQTTVLLLQNPGASPVSVTIAFWSPSGGLLATRAVSIASNASVVLNTPDVPGLSGQSGSITVAHTGAYGAITGKAVSLEPGTGFSFDTPLTTRPH